jgi:putative copper export protein
MFMRCALVPAVGVLTDDERKSLHEQIRSRWAKLIAASVAFLLISGIINFVLFLSESKTAGWEQWRQSYNSLYQFVFGAKFALAMVVFFISSALAGRGEATKKFRQDAKWWMTVNLVLALIVVVLSGVLRFTHVGPTLPKPAAITPAEVTGG